MLKPLVAALNEPKSLLAILGIVNEVYYAFELDCLLNNDAQAENVERLVINDHDASLVQDHLSTLHFLQTPLQRAVGHIVAARVSLVNLTPTLSSAFFAANHVILLYDQAHVTLARVELDHTIDGAVARPIVVSSTLIFTSIELRRNFSRTYFQVHDLG